MGSEDVLLFPPFRLDPADARLWRGRRALSLRPKSFAVLHHLVTHAGRLVTKRELLDAVWGDVHVGDAVVKTAIKEVRQALGDSIEAPRFIATVHRRGYRFIASVQGGARPPVGPPSATQPPASPFLPHQPPSSLTLVGRDAELARLRGSLAEALGGGRRAVLVTGPPGIGKSALLEVFLAPLARRPDLWLAHGQCPRQHGPGEPYLPVLEALGSLCRGPDATPVLATLRRYAPMWLVQLPALLGEAELEALQRRVVGMPAERMLRQMAEAVEALTAERALVLCFDDLQWSDHATLELIDTLARRRPPARLLIVGAYRAGDLLGADHPLAILKQDLTLRGRCEELALEPLPETAVETYCAARFVTTQDAQAPSLTTLPRLLHEHTGGHPLFMTAILDDLVRRGVIVHRDGRWEAAEGMQEIAIPAGVREFVTGELERLEPDRQRLLEAASVAGLEFSTATVAAALEADTEELEATCMDLVRRERFLRPATAEEEPAHAAAARFAFRHDLYREVVYGRLAKGRRRILHRRIGEWRERASGERAREIAATLAVHFEEAHDHLRAASYHRHASEQAQRRHAPREAIEHARRGLTLIQRAAPGEERARQELALQVALGAPIAATKSWAAPELEEAYDRAQALFEQIGEAPELFPMLWGIWAFNVLRARHAEARRLSAELLRLARGAGAGDLLEAHLAAGLTHAWLGEFESARRHLDEGLGLYHRVRDRPHAFRYGQDPRVLGLVHLAWVLWCLGYPEQALAKSEEAVAQGREFSHPHTLAFALSYAAILHHFRREPQAVHTFAEETIGLSTEYGFGQWVAFATFFEGWSSVARGSIDHGLGRMREALATYRATGAEWGEPFFLSLLAEASAKGTRERTEEGARLLSRASTIMAKTGERFFEAEVHRLSGELRLREEAGTTAEDRFRRALEIARRQNARSLELRAATSLARLWRDQGRRREAHDLLAPVYGWFTEGFETLDLIDAKRLLDELA